MKKMNQLLQFGVIKKLMAICVSVAVFLGTMAVFTVTASGFIDDATSNIRYNTDKLKIIVDDNSIKTVNYLKDIPYYATAGSGIATYSAVNGIHLQYENINMKDRSTFAIATNFGNSPSSQGQNIDKAGFMVYYNSEGRISVFKNNLGYKPTDSDTTAINETIEPLDSNGFSIDLKLIDDNFYRITIKNSKSVHNYDFNLSAGSLSDMKNLYISSALTSGGTADEGVNTLANSSFGFNIFDGEDIGTATPPAEISGTSASFRYKKDANGIKVTRLSSGYAFERIGWKDKCYIGENGVNILLKDITSDAASYSLALAIGPASYGMWTDKKGIMLFYNNKGDIAILGFPGGNVDPNTQATVLACAKNTFSDKLEININSNGEKYLFTINGIEYIVDGSYLNNADELSFQMGVMSGYDLDLDNKQMKNLMYWQDNFITSNVSFTIAGINGEVITPDEPDTGESVPPEGMSTRCGEGHFLFESKKDGLYVTSTKDNQAWERFIYNEPYLLENNGLTVDIDKIESKDKNYSLAFFLGGTTSGWYDKKGCMLLYGRNGNTALIGIDGERKENGDIKNPNDAIVLGATSEKFKKSIQLNVKQVNDKYYLVSFNGNEYKVDSEWLSGSDEVYISIGVMSNFNISDDKKHISGLEFVGAKKTKKLTFRISNVEGKHPVDESTLDVGGKNPPSYLFGINENIRYKNTDEGLKITYLAPNNGGERASYNFGYMLDGDGATLNIKNIESRSKTYSVVVGIGGGGRMWYDRKGLMVLYSRNGNLSLVATSGLLNETGGVEDLNNAKVLCSSKLDEFSKNLTIKVKMIDGGYNIEINGMKCFVEADYLNSSDQAVFSFGVMSDYKLDNNRISGLQYWQSGFKTKNVSFMPHVDGVSAEDTAIDGEILSYKNTPFKVVGTDIVFYKAENGIKVVHSANSASWQRVKFNNKFSPSGDGLSLTFSNIESKARNYSIAVQIGDGSWYDTTGYMIIYGKSGNFSIVATDKTITDPNKSPICVSEKREPLGDNYSLNVVLSATNYIVTVNGKSYTLPACHSTFPIKNSKQLTLAFGIMNDAEIGKIDHFGNSYKSNYVSYIVSNYEGMIPDSTFGQEYGLSVKGNYWKLDTVEKGTKVTLGKSGTGLEYISTNETYSTTRGGIDIDIADISSENSNYSIAVMISGTQKPWLDCTGYMVVYGKSGNFAILATDPSAIALENASVAVSEKREPLDSNLQVNARLSGKNYVITVNGKEYTVLAKNKTFPMDERENLYVSFGILSDGEINSIVYRKPVRNCPLSFTLSSIVHSNKDVTDTVEPTVDEPDSKDNNTQSTNTKPKPPETTDKEKIDNSNFRWVIIGISVATLVVLLSGGAIIVIKRKRNSKS